MHFPYPGNTDAVFKVEPCNKRRLRQYVHIVVNRQHRTLATI